MTIEIKDFLMDQLNRDELNELTLGILDYKINNVIPEFSSKLITVSFLFSINDIILNQQIEDKKKSRSEINKQNVMKRWHNKKSDIKLDDNTDTNNTKSDTISNTKLDTKSDTKIIQNNTNENVVEDIDSKAENNVKSIIQTHTNTIQNLYEQNDTNTDTKPVQTIIENNSNKEIMEDINNVEVFEHKDIIQNDTNCDTKIDTNIHTKEDRKLKQLLNEFVTLSMTSEKDNTKSNAAMNIKEKPQLPDIIKDNKNGGNAMKSIANVLAGMNIEITKEEDLPVLEDAVPETTECSQEDKYIKLKQNKNNKDDFEIDMQQIDIVSKQDKNNNKDFKTDIQQINTKLKQDKNNKNNFNISSQNLQDTSKQIKLEQSCKEKERSKEKEKYNNNIYINNNINNNNINNINNNNISKYSLERGCGGKPFLNDDDSSVIDASVLYESLNENISDAEAIVKYIEPVSTPKKKKNEFIPPSIEEIEKYCQDKKLNVDTEHWYNYYEANDWKVNNRGKLVPMKNWKQAVLTWHNNNKRAKTSAVVISEADQQIAKYVKTVEKNTELALSEADKISQRADNTGSQKKKNIISDEEVVRYSESVFGVAEKYSFAVWDKVTARTGQQSALEPLIKNFINKGLKSGKNLIFHGSYGTGKTFYSVLTANTCFQYKRISEYYHTKLSQFLSSIKNEFKTEKRLVYDEAVNTELLILDEFGQGNWSEFDKHTITNLIDDRYSNNLSTIFVTNMSREEFFKRLEPSTASRLASNSIFLDFGNTDLRNSEGAYEAIQA